jgi:hypothetical protein
MDPHFSSDYRHARSRFREAVSHAGGRLIVLPIAAKGPGGDELSIDVGWFGVANPTRAFVHVSGVHGVEGFAGAAIQLQWLESGLTPLREPCAVVIFHVVNPYGMAWLRRANEHNVDLNRNCLPSRERYKDAPDGYEAVRNFLNPPAGSGADWFRLKALQLIWRFGLPTLKQTIAGGQYVDPTGLFFGGTSLEEGPRRVQDLVGERLGAVTQLIGIDVHTGLGAFGADALLVDEAAGAPGFEAVRATFGNSVAQLDPHRSSVYRATGLFGSLFRDALPQADVQFVVQEFGTYGTFRVLRALRSENRRFHQSGGASTSELLDVFVPRNRSWRRAVLSGGRAAIGEACQWLNGSGAPGAQGTIGR